MSWITSSMVFDKYESFSTSWALLHLLFLSTFLQDGIDLFLGNYRVSKDEGRTPETSPVSKELSRKYLALPIIILVSFSMCIMNLLLPATSFREQLTYVFFWGAASISTLAITIFWGKELVDAPKLYTKVKRDWFAKRISENTLTLLCPCHVAYFSLSLSVSIVCAVDSDGYLHALQQLASVFLFRFRRILNEHRAIAWTTVKRITHRGNGVFL